MIQTPKKIEVRHSPIHGLGIFAINKIIQGEIIEECPILSLPIEKGTFTSLLIDYRFNWPQGTEWEEQVVALGYGSLYNHSETANAYWISNYEKRTFLFIASRDIDIDEEVCVWYGDVNYWNDGRQNISLV